MPSPSHSIPRWAWILLWIVAGIIRLVLLPRVGHWPDLGIFLTWSEAVRTVGFVNMYHAIALHRGFPINYPPVFLYLLAISAKLFGPLTAATIKLPAYLFDTFTAVLVWHVLHAAPRTQFLATAAVLLNPAIFLISGYWGQVDIIHTFFVSVAFVAATRNRFSLAALAITIAVFTKIQAVVFLPPLIALCCFAHRSLLRPILTALTTAVALAAPFLFTGHALDLVRPFVDVTRLYPYVTLNAMNMWWPVGSRVLVPDHTLFFGVPAVWVGIGFVVIAWAYTMWFLSEQRTFSDVMFAAAFVALAFFFCATDMHERYSFPVFLFLPLAFGAHRRTHLALLGALTAAFLANIFYVMPFDAPFFSGWSGLAQFLLVDVWWVVYGAALVSMVIIMYRRARYATTPHRNSGLQ